MDTLTNEDSVSLQTTEQHHHHDQHEDGIKDEHHMMHLSDMSELPQDLQEGIVSIPKEIILITLVSQEQSLYNPRHEQYRNIQRKDAKWQQIAENVGWSETQCKNKWKAMRDQYCRELKRFKFNTKANIKWKYFKELEFLRPYALSRHYRPRHPSAQSKLQANLNNNSSLNNTIVNSNSNNNNSNSNNNNNNNNSSTNNNNGTTQFNGSCISNALGDTISIKIETTQLTGCEFTTIKSEPPTRLLTSLTSDQLESVNWNNYLNVTTASTPTTATPQQSNNTEHNLLQQQQHHQPQPQQHQHQHQPQQQHTQIQQQSNTADEVLYKAFVDCMNSTNIDQQLQVQEQSQNTTTSMQQSPNNQVTIAQTQTQTQINDVTTNSTTTTTTTANTEDDEDPIHIFLNYESFFEKELIALVKQEDILYNNYNLNYRNLKRKKEVWREIAKKLKKTEKQCRGKWKALRDQYIREHKRLRDREDIELLPRWKNYDALNFLKKFIRHKSELDSKNLLNITKSCTQISEDIEDGQLMTEASLDDVQDQKTTPQLLQLQGLPALSGPHRLQQQTAQSRRQQQQHHHDQGQNQHHLHETLIDEQTTENNANSICVSADYDEMDIDTYIIGDSNQGHQHHQQQHQQHAEIIDDVVDEDDDEDVDDEEPDNCDPIEQDDEESDADDADTDNAIIPEETLHKTQHQQQQDQQQHFINFKRTNASIVLLQQHSKQHAVQHHQQQHTDEIDDDNDNDVDEDDVDEDDEEQEIKDIKTIVTSVRKVSPTMTTYNGVNIKTQTLNQQQHAHEEPQQQQQQQIMHYNVDNKTANLTNLQQHQVFHPNEPKSTNLLNENCSTASSKSNNIFVSEMPVNTAVTPTLTTVAAAIATTPMPPTPTTLNTDDDEVGAFFKAVAMKIRSAKMTPTDFTDLQINILRVINGSLRNF